jgi:hypothetical protein
MTLKPSPADSPISRYKPVPAHATQLDAAASSSSAAYWPSQPTTKLTRSRAAAAGLPCRCHTAVTVGLWLPTAVAARYGEMAVELRKGVDRAGGARTLDHCELLTGFYGRMPSPRGVQHDRQRGRGMP